MEIRQKYTIAEATKFLGFSSRSTLNKRTKAQGNDSISYELDETGNKVISSIELERVFPDKFKEALKRTKDTANTVHTHSTIAQKNTEKNTANTGQLSSLVEVLKQQLEYERMERIRERQEAQERERKAGEREENARTMIDKLTDTINRHTLLIADNRPEMPVQRQKGFFGRFLRKQ